MNCVYFRCNIVVRDAVKVVDFKHLPQTAVGSIPDRDFGFFHVRKLSS
jgi:hypothetical protein